MSRSKEKEDNNISVIIRIKPEDYSQKYAPIDVSNSNSISILSENKEYFFDYIGEENSTQNDIFERCGKKICDYALEGYNGTIFAYGQTGSGKTYTLLGKNITNKLENKNINISALINNAREDIKMSELNNDISSYYDTKDENIGLLPRILYYLFQNKEKSEEDNKYIFKISYLELYKEKMIDLLFPGGDNNNIRISDSNKVLEIKNLRKFMIDSPEEAIKLIIDGNRFRHTAATLMNDESSRSHAIISIYIENTLINENKVKKSVFHIIDLAGSERQTKTGTFGERVKEAGEINKSLLNLSIVINQIINNAKQISYRDSKLTHLLKDSLGGNAKTSIIATISKLESNLRETINTLNFAQNAKKIKNKAIINEELSGKDAKFLLEKLDNLQKNYNSMVQQCTKLKKELQNQRNSINEKDIMSKSLEIQNEDMNKVMNDILEKEEELKKCQEENDALKDKIEKNELAFKLKDNDIKIFKIKLNNLNDEKIKLMKENNELINKIKILEKENNKKDEIIKIIKENPKKMKEEKEVKKFDEMQKENI
jgi:kinesin family protein 15